MFRRSLESMGLARPRTSTGRRLGGGILLPLLGFLGWKYRDEIKKFVQDRFGGRTARPTNAIPERP